MNRQPQHLDLTLNGKLTDPILAIYQQTVDENRKDFAHFIGSLVDKDNLDWWLQAPATRNQTYTHLFRHVCTALTLERILKLEAPPSSVKVESVAMASIVSNILEEADIDANIMTPPLMKRLITRVRSVFSPFRSMGRLLLEWGIIRISAGIFNNERKVDSPIILIDTFAIPGFVKSDRYYPQLFELSGEYRKFIRFAPQFMDMSLKQLRNSVFELAKLPNQYLIKETYINLYDIFWCFWHWGRIRKTRLDKVIYKNIDITTLTRNEIKSNSAYRCAVRGLLNYRFIRSLKRHGIIIRKAIDWFENHPLDRGWNAGLNQFFPGVNSVGYTGYYPAGQSYRPTREEFNAGILPQKQLVIGKGFNQDISEFFDNCVVESAPALRYTQLPALRTDIPSNVIILVALPYYKAMCLAVLDIIIEMAELNPTWKFIIKPHPAQTLDTLGFNRHLEIENIEASSDAISHLLPKSIAMITGAQASTIIESAACGVPTIIISDNTIGEEISIPSGLSKILYTICHNKTQTQAAITNILNQALCNTKEIINAAKDFNSKSFTPVNDFTVTQMLST